MAAKLPTARLLTTTQLMNERERATVSTGIAAAYHPPRTPILLG